MTPRPPTDAERLLTVNETAALAQHYSTVPHTVSHLRASIDDSIDDGLKGTSYDGIGGPGGDSSPTERAAVGEHREGCTDDDTCSCPDQRSDRAVEDLSALDRALAHWREGTAIMRYLDKRYSAASIIRTLRPGEGPAPTGKCVDHWAASIAMDVAKKRYTLYCRRCGDHRRDHDASIPPLVLQAVQEAGGDWQSWRVRRAWDAA